MSREIYDISEEVNSQLLSYVELLSWTSRSLTFRFVFHEINKREEQSEIDILRFYEREWNIVIYADFSS